MVHSDDYGLVLPPKIAPTKVAIIPIKETEEVKNYIESLQKLLEDNNITYIVDNSNKSAGYKFAETEVNGIPIRIEVGPRDLENNSIVLARRDTREKLNISTKDLTIEKINSILNDIQESLYNRAKKRRDAMTYTAKNMDDMANIIDNNPGFIKAMWCGSMECENKIKETRGIKSRCIPFKQEEISTTCVCCGKKAKEMVIWGIQY